MSNIVIFGATQSGKTTLLGYLSTAMMRHPQFNDEVLQQLKLIKSLTTTDEFSIGDPYNPINVNKDVILPSFVSLDKDELRKFRGIENSEGSTKRLHHKQLTICMSERHQVKYSQNENENISCVFVDMPGFRQRLSDKYFGFFEGQVGIAVLKLKELVDYYELLKSSSADSEKKEKIDRMEMRLFEPIRIWCDFRSSSHLVIAISQIDRNLVGINEEDAIRHQIEDIDNAIKCIRLYTSQFDRGNEIPITPISIRVTNEPNNKKQSRMARFFRREEENIYAAPSEKKLPGDGTFISCLKRVIPFNEVERNRVFSMASINRPMKAIVNYAFKTALNIHALHGTIHKTDILNMGPIIDKRNNEIIFAECDISSIKADGAIETSEMLMEGNVGGVIFKSIKAFGTRCEYNISSIPKESDISILKSTILYSGKIKKGDIIKLEINKKDHITINDSLDEMYSKVLMSIMPFDQLFLFWYGKKLSVNVVEIAYYDDKIQFSIIVSKCERDSVHFFVLPCDDNGTIRHQDTVLLAIPLSYYSTMSKKYIKNKYTYVSSNIVGISNSFDLDAIEIKTNINMGLDIILSDTCCNGEAKDGNSFIIPLESKQNYHDIYSALLMVARNIKKWFNRLVYRQLGGVRLTLLKSDTVESDKSKL